MITLSDNIFASLSLPLDARQSNLIIQGSDVIVETKEEYLSRVDIDSRYPGMEVFLCVPSGIYDIIYFSNAIKSGSITSVKYKFAISTDDSSFLPDTVSGGGSGHVIKDETQTFPQRTHLTFKGAVVTDNESTESTDVDFSVNEDITSFGVGDVGGINEGEIITQGTNLTDFIKQLMQTSIPLVEPVASISISPSSTQEIGDIIDFTITPGFTQNDAGNLNQVVIKRGNVTLINQSSLTPYLDDNQTILQGNNQYSVDISYDEGVEDSQKDGTIPAGTKTTSKNIIGSYVNWFGPNGSSEPINGSEIRNLNGSFSNIFTLNTGNSDTIHIIAIPSSKSLTSVIDLDALNANITSSYLESGTLTTVPDASGTNVNYRVYVLTLAASYSSNHRHYITIS